MLQYNAIPFHAGILGALAEILGGDDVSETGNPIAAATDAKPRPGFQTGKIFGAASSLRLPWGDQGA
jgi:hypothetical protein